MEDLEKYFLSEDANEAVPERFNDNPFEVPEEPEAPKADFSELKKYFAENLEVYFAENQERLAEQSTMHPEMSGIPQNYAESWSEVIAAGWQRGFVGLRSRQKLPDQQISPDAGVFKEIASGLAETVGDLPVTLWGAAAGALPGLTTAPVTGPGSLIPALLGAEVMSNAAPAAVKKIYMDMLERGEVTTWTEFVTRANGAMWEAAKGGAVGAASFGTGQVSAKIAGPLAKKFLVNQIAQNVTTRTAQVGTEIAVMSAMPKLMEGQLPSARDFVVGAGTVMAARGVVKLGGIGGAPVVKKLQSIVKQTDVPLKTVLDDAARDPIVLQNLLSDDPEIPKAYEGMRTVTPEKPLVEGAEVPAPIVEKAPTRIRPTPEDLKPLLPELENEVGDADQAYLIAPPVEDVVNRTTDERGSTSGNKADGILRDAYGKEISPEAQLILSKIGLEKETLLDKVHNFPNTLEKTVDKAIEEVLNEALPLKRLEQQMARGKTLDVLQSPHDLYNLQLSAGKAKSWLYDGVEDFDTGERVTRGLVEIYKPVSKDGRRFKAYQFSARVVELNAQGKKVPFDLEAAKKIYETDKAEFDAIHKEVVSFNNAKLDYLGKAMGWPDEITAAIKEMGQNYVSLQRLFEPEEGAAKGSRPSMFSPVKKLKGSELYQVMDPVQSAAENTVVVAQLAVRNRMNQAALKLANSYKDQVDPKFDNKGKIIPSKRGMPGILEVVDEKRPIKISKEVEQFISDHGLLEPYLDSIKTGEQFKGLLKMKDALQELTVWRNKNNGLAPEQSVVWVDGKRKILQAASPEIGALLRGGDYDSLNILQKLARPFTKMLTVGATVNPSFISRNPVMDMFTTWLKADKATDAIPVVTQLRGLYHDLLYPLFHEGQKSDVIASWESWNGEMVSGNDVINKFVKDVAAERKPGVAAASARGLRQVIRTPWDALIALRDLSERSTRIGIAAAEQSRQLKSGPMTNAKRAKVALTAKNSTINYQEKGRTIRGANSSIAFLSVHFKSLEAGFEPLVKHPERFATRVLPLTALFMANMLRNKDHPQYDSLNDYEKINYFHIPSDDWQPATKEDFPDKILPEIPNITRKGTGYAGMEINRGKPWRIKIPETLIPFTSLPASLVERFMKDRPDIAKNLPGDLLGTAGDVFLPEYAPSALKPLMEIEANHNSFTGHQIIPQSRMQLAPYLRFQPYTSESAKLLASGINEAALHMGFDSTDVSKYAAPANIDHMVTGWLAGLGKLGLDASDAALRSLGLTPKNVGERPEKEFSDMPVVSAWVRKFPSFNPAYARGIYERFDKVQQNIATFKELARKQRDPVAARQFIATLEKNDLVNVRGYKDTVTQIRQKIQNIHENKKLKGYEKTQLINGHLFYLHYVSKRGSELIDKVDRQVRDAKAHYKLK